MIRVGDDVAMVGTAEEEDVPAEGAVLPGSAQETNEVEIGRAHV